MPCARDTRGELILKCPAWRQARGLDPLLALRPEHKLLAKKPFPTGPHLLLLLLLLQLQLLRIACCMWLRAFSPIKLT